MKKDFTKQWKSKKLKPGLLFWISADQGKPLPAILRDDNILESFETLYFPEDNNLKILSTCKYEESMKQETSLKFKGKIATIEEKFNSSINLTEKDLRTAMRDPRYWKFKDTKYIKMITNIFSKLYPKE